MSQSAAPVEEQKKKKPAETQEPSTGSSPQEPTVKPESEEFKKAVAQAIKDQFRVTDAWMPREILKFVVSCPSGQQVLVKHLDTLDLIRADLVEDLDSFQRKLFPATLDDQGRPVERDAGRTFLKMMSNPTARVRFLDVTGRLMAVCSIKPKIVNDGVTLVDRDTFKRIIGEDTANEAEQQDIFGYQVESIDDQIKLFGKPVPPLAENEAYAGVIGLPDRFTFFTELNKPLELIAPFREPSESISGLETMQGNGSSSE